MTNLERMCEDPQFKFDLGQLVATSGLLPFPLQTGADVNAFVDAYAERFGWELQDTPLLIAIADWALAEEDR